MWRICTKRKEVNSLIHKEIEQINKSLAPHEQIKFFRLVNDSWDNRKRTALANLKAQTFRVEQHYEKIISRHLQVIRTATVNDKAALREIWSAAFGVMTALMQTL